MSLAGTPWTTARALVHATAFAALRAGLAR